MLCCASLRRAAQVKKGIQWLAGPRHEASRLAGVLVLQELAMHAPAVFNVHVRAFIEVIWNPLRDPRLQIREAAVAALQVRVRRVGGEGGRSGHWLCVDVGVASGRWWMWVVVARHAKGSLKCSGLGTAQAVAGL